MNKIPHTNAPANCLYLRSLPVFGFRADVLEAIANNYGIGTLAAKNMVTAWNAAPLHKYIPCPKMAEKVRKDIESGSYTQALSRMDK